MDFNSDKQKKFALWIIGIITACIIIFLAVQNIDVIANAFSWCVNLISPLLLGLAFALVLNVPMSFFYSHLFTNSKNTKLLKLRKPLAYIISLVLIFGILIGVIWLVIPALVEAVKLIINGIITFIDKLSTMTEIEFAQLPFGSILLEIDWDKWLNTIQNLLKDQSGNIMNTTFDTIGSVVGGVVDFFISFVFSVYILFGKEKLKKQAQRLIHAWLPKNCGNAIIHIADVAGVNFRNFISGQSIEAVILGVLCMIGMLILKIPYAPMVGALVGVTALVPVVGSFIGAIVGAFMILTVEPIKAVIFIIFLLILQQIEGNVIYPKVMGSRVNLPGMWILASVTVGGSIAGPLGMLLSVPIASTLYVLIKEATAKREEKLKNE